MSANISATSMFASLAAMVMLLAGESGRCATPPGAPNILLVLADDKYQHS